MLRGNWKADPTAVYCAAFPELLILLFMPDDASTAPDLPRSVFLVWKPEGYAFRLHLFARALNAEVLHSYKDRLMGGKVPAPVRYVLQGFDTYRRLKEKRPGLVVVQTPPWPATFTAWLYCRRYGACFITDNHSSTFTDPRWTVFNFIDRFLFKRALCNLAHNHKNLAVLESWGANNPMMLRSPAVRREAILPDDATVSPELAEQLNTDKLKILYINRFTPLNAWQEVFDAARLMPDARFFITGNPADVNLKPEDIPENVILPGFMPHHSFLKLMDSVDVVLSLTKLKDALAWTYRECLALGKPFVGTNNEVAVANFGEYGLFTNPEPKEIAEKLQEVWRRRDEFVPKMAAYIEADEARWAQDIATITGLIRERQACPSSRA